jgi:predicted RNA-binding Zn ribbon-like protein
MTFRWTRHRFSGGRLALDVANTVILRHDPARTIDRFAAPEDFAAFPIAAARYCSEPEFAADLATHIPGSRDPLIILREAIDRNFRAVVMGTQDRRDLSALLIAAGTVLGESNASALALATVRSAMKLMSEGDASRLRICKACGWLFYDRSRNRKRIWCDMTVCGNREKARRHYSNTRQKIAAQEGKP